MFPYVITKVLTLISKGNMELRCPFKKNYDSELFGIFDLSLCVRLISYLECSCVMNGSESR